ncbi:MAG: hypothetical protein JO054_10220 [Actinobacteria bacterium]|nr:hypothetical protein [Actinomycetota bacterium]MBV8958270.1 hypothetical protein [Actinomycetota bacterium]MBV9254597.1 hypothetical protein [Actinomycetota bacterium]
MSELDVMDVQELHEQLAVAQHLLSQAEGDHERRDLACEMLGSVEALLGHLAIERGIETNLADRLLGLRDDLGGHLLAAATLDDVGVPSHAAVELLRRAADTTQAGLRLLTLDQRVLAGRN